MNTGMNVPAPDANFLSVSSVLTNDVASEAVFCCLV